MTDLDEDASAREHFGPTALLQFGAQVLLSTAFLAIVVNAVSRALRARFRTAAAETVLSDRGGTEQKDGAQPLARGRSALLDRAAHKAEERGVEERERRDRRRIERDGEAQPDVVRLGGAGPNTKPRGGAARRRLGHQASTPRRADADRAGAGTSLGERRPARRPSAPPAVRSGLLPETQQPLPFSAPPRYMPRETSASVGASGVREQQDLAYMASLAEDMARVRDTSTLPRDRISVHVLTRAGATRMKLGSRN